MKLQNFNGIPVYIFFPDSDVNGRRNANLKWYLPEKAFVQNIAIIKN